LLPPGCGVQIDVQFCCANAGVAASKAIVIHAVLIIVFFLTLFARHVSKWKYPTTART